MIQKKFLCKDFEEARGSIGQIQDILTGTAHRSALVTFYEAGLSKQEVTELIALLKGCGDPGLQVAGISIVLVAELMPTGTGVLLNMILTEKSEIEVVQIPCMPGGEAEAAGRLRSRLDAHENVKAVELFVSNMELNTTSFMEQSMEGHEDAVLFGTSTIRNLNQKVSVEESENMVEVEQTEDDSASE